MPNKPNKVQAAGVALFADGGILSRMTSLSADTDLGVEEIREISNSSVVEFVEGTPTVTVQIEANQIGIRDNIAFLTGQDGSLQSSMISPGKGGLPAGRTREITHFSFDGTQSDLVIQVEEDSVLARSIYIPNAFVTSLSWSFDVGGVATESYTLEADDKRQYVGAKKELVVVSGWYDTTSPLSGSGFRVTPHYNLDPVHGAGTYFVASSFSTAMHAGMAFTPIEASVDGVVLKNTSTGAALVPVPGIVYNNDYVLFPSQFVSQITNGRIRILGYKDTPSSTISADTTYSSTPNRGGARKGQVEIFLISGAPWMYEGRNTSPEKFFRLQTCSIDVDLSRETLEELGNSQAVERSLNFPISATVNFSALDSDVQAWAAFANLRNEYDNSFGGSVQKIGFRDFLQTAGVLIKVYDDDDTNPSRNRLMTITVSGIRVASESFSVDAGGNAVQEFSCSADNFVIS